MPPLGKLVTFLCDTVRRHGGGIAGIRSIAIRGLRVTRALGVRGLLWRIRAAQQRQAGLPPADVMLLSPSAPLTQVSLNIGVMAHVFYTDLLEELATELTHIPLPYVLLVSVVDEAARARAEEVLSGLPQLKALHVRTVPNRGRDIAPLLVTFRDDILALDLVCHVHTKKSLYGGREQSGWRQYLFSSLLGSHDRLAWIFGMFEANPALGIVYPENYADVPLWGHTWLSNADWGRELSGRLGFSIDPTAYIDYPAGSMFWARTRALRPLFELGLRTDSFPLEQGQTDGTLQHAIERLLCFVARQQNMSVGVLPGDGVLALKQEGERNRQLYFDEPLRQKVDYFATGARWISFDIFDTLVIRPFLTAHGARDFLSSQVQKIYGVEDFGRLRTQAEEQARAAAGKDVDLAAIYATLAQITPLRAEAAQLIQDLELSTEQRSLVPRQQLVQALDYYASNADRKVMAVSDMYLSASNLRTILPNAITAPLKKIYVSCDTGWRKDTDAGWRALLGAEHADPRHWLHIGDNEQSDVMQPLRAGLMFPVHVLRPAAYLDVVPALRGLRPSSTHRGLWPHELWLGLVANHFAQIGDSHPEYFAQSVHIEKPESFGYTVLGPLIADYLTWLARTCVRRGSNKILFLSREGYLLHRLFQHMRAHVPALADIEGNYLLVSRRGVNMPAMHTLDDLRGVFRKPFTGSFFELIDSRLGSDAANAVLQGLGRAKLDEEVYLPEMADQLLERLRPLAPALAEVAQRERMAYRQYWLSQVAEDDRLVVADIGYEGSIQAQLSRVVGRQLGGAYFAVKREIQDVLIGGQWAEARYYDGRTDNQASPVLLYHLLLESVMTAPTGQFCHFEGSGDDLIPFHRDEAAHGQRWPILEKIHAGAEQFVSDLVRVAGNLMLDFEADPEAVQEPLRNIGSGRWHLGSWSQAFVVDDNYTGRGQVATRPSEH
jgi:FMN phosphatase YigB (HAD superfamily)